MSGNYKMVLSYDGTRYLGWERQPGRENTIQGKVEHVLAVMTGQDVEVIGAGRTDAGVHALGMVVNVRLVTERTPEEIRDYLNEYLPEDISVRSVCRASERFHSRYNATGKTYRYTCWVDPVKPVFDRKYVYVTEKVPDVERMREAAEFLIGEHDFASFCGNPRRKKSTVRRVDRIEIREDGPRVFFTYSGNGFLQYMVRILTGTLLEVGFGVRTPGSMEELLAAKDRTQAGFTAPARGLCLLEVRYD